MKKEETNIKIDNTNSKKIEDFEKKEWIISDLEHYGRSDIDFTKKKYKFISENKSSEILWTLELSIEINLAFIESLLVSSKHRKSWIGKSLIEKAESFAKEKGCSKIYLETNEWWWAEEFYKKVWYKITWRHEKHILNQNTLIFTKFL